MNQYLCSVAARCHGGRIGFLLAALLILATPAAAEEKIPPAKSSAPATSFTPEQLAFFESKVRPVLVQRCVECHGEKQQKGGLRLDSREAVLKGADGEPVVILGKPQESRLIEVLAHQGDLKMPPKGKLPDGEIAALTEWVKQGLPFPAQSASGSSSPKPLTSVSEILQARATHWAFQPVRKPPAPALTPAQQEWCMSRLDELVMAQLATKGLTPSPRADKRTLLRRVTFDLIGLPPTPAELAAFEADSSPEAFAKVVDRLLASPHYGERWGRYWLDVARYADTKGYVFLQEPNLPFAYTYRDYVVRSLNEDLPYDQFLLQQLAADQLPLGDDKYPLAALGFLTVGPRFMNNTNDIIDDRIDVVMRGLQGMTLTCARCHDHKYDPLPAADYYSLYGVFASTHEPNVLPLFKPAPQTPEYAAYEKELKIREAKLADFVQQKYDELVNSSKTKAAEYLLAAHQQTKAPNTSEFMLLADGADLNPKMITRWQALLERTKKKHHPVLAPWHQFAALPEAEFASKALALIQSWQTSPQPERPLHPLVVQAFVAQPPQKFADVAQRYSQLWNVVDKIWQGQVQLAKLLQRPPPGPLADPHLEELRQIFYGPDSPPQVPFNPEGDLELLPDRPSQAKLRELRTEVEKQRNSGAGAPPRAMVLQDNPQPYQPRVFPRGNPSLPGEIVPRQFPLVLAGEGRQPFAHGSGRLELARAIIDPQNPLTARVLVNRVWLRHFGAGLVSTPSDFGLRSDPPSNPALLDELAYQFIHDGWSLKKLHRAILLSAVYQQRSDDRAEARAIDPENRLLWRANRQRLDFEATRDALLATSGTLDRTVGGPAFNLFATPFHKRRTLYGSIDRLNLPGLFRTFDFPSPDSSSPQRDNTTVAPQALYFMNHPFVQEMAQSLLKRPEIANEPDLDKRLAQLYQILFQRAPSPAEVSFARSFLRPESPATLAQSWPRLAHALLLTNEFVFVD